MAEKKSWRDYSGENAKNRSTGSWRNYSSFDAPGTMVNNWIKNHNFYITGYQQRYEGRKGNYEDAYVSDSADWVNTVNQWNSRLNTEAEEILSYLDQYSGYLDENWVNDVKKTITGARGAYDLILDSAKKDNEYWANFVPNEDQAAAGYTAEQIYNEWQTERKQYESDKVFDIDAGLLKLEELKKGRAAYLAEQEEQRKKAESEESILEMIGRWLGTTPDTSLPLGGVNSSMLTSPPIRTNYDIQIDELEEQINRAKYVQGYEGFMSNANADDFDAKSQYVSTRTEVAMDDAMFQVYGGTSAEGGAIYYPAYDKSSLFGDFLYDYINKNQDALDAATVNDGTTNDYFLGLDEGFLQTMEEDEVKVYNYLYHTQGKEAANEFLTFIGSDLRGRRRQQEQAYWAARAKEDPFKASVFSTLVAPLKGFSYLGQVADMLDDGKLEENAGYNRFSDIPTAIRNQVSTTITKSGKWGEVGSFAYNTAMSMADFLYTTAISGGNQALSLSIMGTGAAADATISAKNRGLGDGEAFTLGTIAGLAEVAMEKISLGAWLEGDMSEGALRYMLKNALSEGGEEASTSVVNLLADVIIAGDKSEWNVAMQTYIDQGKSPEEAFGLVAAEQAAKIGLDAIGGALSGTVIGGGTYAGTSAVAGIQYGNIGKNNAFAQNLVNEGIKLNPDSQYVQKAKSKVDKGNNLTGMQVRNILAANQKQITANDMKKIQQAAEKRLSNLGQTENVSKLAEIATKWATGQDITRAEKKFLTSSQYGSKVAHDLLQDGVVNEVNSESYNKKSIRSILDKMASMEQPNAYNPLESRQETAETTVDQVVTEVPNTAQVKQAESVENPAVVAVETATGKESSVTTDGVTRQVSTGQEVIPRKITSISGGKVMIATDSGTVSADDIEFGDTDTDLLWRSATQFQGINVAGANGIIHAYRSGQPVATYLHGAAQEFRNGYYNMESGGEYADKLTPAQREIIYELGQKAAGENTAKAQAVAKNATTTKKGAAAKESSETADKKEAVGTVHFDRKGRTFDQKRETALKTMEQLSKALGIEFYVFESYVNEAGERVYKDANGNEVHAPNGFYDPMDGSIHIDLNAGADGNGTMLFTIAHELTHFVKQWSPAKFKVLANFLITQYSEKGVSVEKLVDTQIAKANKNGRTIDYDTAFEEVVADSMEAMLVSGNVVQMMAELKQRDKTLWQKICDWFKDLVADLKAVADAYKDHKPDSIEGRMVAQMQETIEILERAYADALLDAGDNYQAGGAQKNTTSDGGVKQEAAQKRSDRIVDQIRTHIAEIMALDSVYTIDASNATPYTSDRKTDAKSGGAVFKAQGGVANRSGFGRVVLSNRGAVHTIYHGNGPAKQAAFPAIKAVIEQGIEIYRDNNHSGRGYDTITFAAPITFFGAESPLAVVVKSFESVNSDKTFYIHEICDAEGNYIQMAEEDSNKKTSSANFVEPTSTVSAADDGIAPEDNVAQNAEIVKNESSETVGIDVDEKTESVAPSVMFSERTWTESDYVQERNKAAKEIAKAIGVSEKKAMYYIDSVNSIAKMIADDRSRLDYFSSPGRSSFVGNVEYGGSFDFSTLCKKRRLLTGTFTAIQKALPNTALTADEILDIRNRMKEANLEVSCGLCYVEGSRANMGQFTKEFLKLYKQYYPDAWQPNMADVNTPDGIEWVRINHPEVYEQYEYFWNHYGTLKEGDKNLFASQQKPKLYQLHTEYKGEILEKFKDDDNVEEKNLNGGIRLQSFSDFEIVHLIDTMQIIMDMSRVGLSGQAYTKVPDFAWALGDTGLKINLSLIAKGVDASGKLIFDDVEGMPIDTAVKLRNRYSKNVGTILVAFNDEQLLAAMADDRVDFIIPFHRSQWKKSQYGAMGLPAKTKDYTYMQNEKYINPQFHEYRGRMVKDKASNYMPNEYWDFSKSGKENAVAYLEMCARNNKRPKFYKLLQNNGDGSYSLKADGSTDGYWKLLIDFKMYDNEGVGSPQMAVKPEFNMEEANRMLNDYKGGHSTFPVAKGIVDSFVKDYKASHKGEQYSSQETDLDSDGNRLTKAQQEFFKDSMVRDAAGNLLVMYHGTKNGDFTVFDRTKAGKRTGFSVFGKGNYFTVFENGAAHYGSRVIPAYLKIANPIITSAKSGAFNADVAEVLGVKATEISTQTISERIKEAGYDGVIVYGVGEDEGNIVICVAYESAQIKEVSNKNPTSDPDIRYSERDPELEKVNRVLEKENTELKQDIAYLKELLKLQKQVTGGTKFTKTSVEAAADQIMKYANANGKKKELASLLNGVYEYIAKGDELTWDGVKEAAQPAVDWLQSHMVTEAQPDGYGYYEELLDQDLLRQVYDSYWNVSTLYTVSDKAQKDINRLKLEHSKRMSDLRQFHKEKTAQLKDEHREALQKVKQAERDRLDRKLQQTKEQYQQSREKNAENRRKAEMRKKIRRTIMDLGKLLNRGDKQRNVKEGMKDLVSEALKSADILFTDNYSNEDMVRYGVGTELTEKESRYIEEARELMEQLGNLPSGSYEAFQERQEIEGKLKGQLSYRMGKLQEVFARERARLNKTKVSDVLGGLADAYASLESSEQNYVSESYQENVYQYLQMLKTDVGGTIVKDMSLNQLEELHKAYTMVLTTVRNANKMFAANLQKTREQLGNQVISEVQQVGGEHGLWLPGEDKLSAFSWNNQKPGYAFERIGSQTLIKLFENIRAGEDRWALDMTEAREYYLEQTRKRKYDSWDFDKQYQFTSTSGIDFSLNLEQIMSLYAYSKREQAHDHLLKGGFVFDGNTEVQVNKMGIKVTYLNKTAKAHNVSMDILTDIVSTLTEEQKAFVDAMQDYLSTTMGEKGNEVSLQLYGVKLFNEQHYFPLRSAGQFMERAKEADLKKQQGQISIVNSGFAKATTPKSSNPVVLSGFMDVWADHVNEMSMYHSFVLPMEDFRRVYNYSSPNMEDGQSVSVNSVIQDAYGEAATGYIDQLYRDLNGGAVSDPRETPAKALIGKFKKAAVFASLSVVVQQPSAIGRAFAIIDPKHFIGSKVDSKRHKALWAELKKYAPVAVIKEMGYFDTGMGKSAQDFIQSKEYGTLKEKAAALFTDSDYRDEVLSKAPALADELTWCAIWEAAKRETKAKNPDLRVSSEEFLQLAGKRFTEVITKTQVYDSVLSRSANMRSKGALMSMWTAFMAEPTTTINMVEDALRKGKRGDKKYAAKAMGAVLTSVILNSVFSSMVYAMWDDDEDETFLEKYTQSFATEILEGVNPITYYPFLKDIWSALQGFDIERADMSLITSLTEKVTKLVQVYDKDTDDMDEDELAAHNKKLTDAWWGVADYVTALAGIPVKNVRRDINGAINTVKTIADDLTDRDTSWGSLIDKTWDSVKDSLPMVGWLPDKTAADRLYQATVSGDTAYQKRLESSYATESSLNSAIRKGLRANDARIVEAAIAWNNNDMETYSRIAKEIIAEGNFSQDNVVMAIQAEAKARAKKNSDTN